MTDSKERKASVYGDEEDEGGPVALKFKVIVLGDGAVGKTSIVARCTQDTFAASYKQTIGLDFSNKQVALPGDIFVTLQIWDIGGQSLGSKMIRNYIHGADAVVLTYDITNYQSFQDLSDWLSLVHQTFLPSSGQNSDSSFHERLPYLAVVANKVDLQHLRTVKIERHEQFADEHRAASFFVSAKTGDSVSTAFTKIAADLAEVPLTRGQLDAQTHVVAAPIINYPQHDADTQTLKLKEEHSKCSIQ